MDGYRRLVVFSGREHGCAWSGWWCFADKRSHHAAHGFDTQRQRGYVEQQNVFHIASQYTALNGSTDRHGFIRVNVFTRFFTKELGHFLLHHRHTSLTTNEDHVVDI